LLLVDKKITNARDLIQCSGRCHKRWISNWHNCWRDWTRSSCHPCCK